MSDLDKITSSIVKRLIDNGTMDELVAAVLEDALESNFQDLEKLTQRKYLEAHHWQDYADCITFSQACIKVLRYFTIDNYEAEQVKANHYAMKLMELY